MEIDSQDVIRLIQQFLKENNLLVSLQALQKETGIALNTVDNVDKFALDIRQGRWDVIIPQLATLKLPQDKLVIRSFLDNIYDQSTGDLMRNKSNVWFIERPI